MLGQTAADFRSGFVTLVGRPNVGKSTLLNSIIGRKVAIVSDKPQTTRTQIRGVRTTANSQIVFLDTPGIHRARTMLGERTNRSATDSLKSVDLVCFLVEAHTVLGKGDHFIADLVKGAGTQAICVVNKIDLADKDLLIAQLTRLGSGELGEFAAFVPLSGTSGEGIDALVAEIESRLEIGPRYYPEEMTTDQPETFLAAELVREQLIADAREELPHSIAVLVDEFEERTTKSGDPLLAMRAVVRVERDSQKGIVIGKGGERLKRAGTNARMELEKLLGARVHLEIAVRVDPDWQRKPKSLDRMGF